MQVPTAEVAAHMIEQSLLAHWRLLFFFFQAEDGIRDVAVTGVQTCALPISHLFSGAVALPAASPEPQTVALSSAAGETSARLDRLEEQVQRLREELQDLKGRLPP